MVFSRAVNVLARKIIFVLCALLLLSCSESNIVQYYVAKQGNDGWSGKYAKANSNRTDGPLATVQRALEIIELNSKRAKSASKYIINIRSGTYEVFDSIRVVKASGETNPEIIIRAYHGEKVVFCGGKKLSHFEKLPLNMYKGRISNKIRANLFCTDLKSNHININNIGSLYPRGFGIWNSKYSNVPYRSELYQGDKRYSLARWPNSGWAKIAGTLSNEQKGGFIYDGKRPERWKGKDIWLHGYWFYNWADSYEKVASIDTINRRIVTCPPYSYYGYKAGARYYAFNVLSELDKPGEWYLDNENGRVIFWPLKNRDTKDIYLSYLRMPFIVLDNVSNFHIEDLIFEKCRGNAIEIRNSRNVTVNRCTIRNIGLNGIVIENGFENKIIDSHLYNIGESAIILDGGDRLTLQAGKNVVEGNRIHDFSVSVRTRPGIRMSGVGNRIIGNEIFDAPDSAIIFRGNDHLIDSNTIYNVCMETDDAGAIYAGRDWTYWGNRITNNDFHDIGQAQKVMSTGRGFWMTAAVYMDDLMSGTVIQHNSFDTVIRGVMINGGRYNTVRYNLFNNCGLPVYVSESGLGRAAPLIKHPWGMYDKLKRVRFNEPPYSVKYPQLAHILKENPEAPEGNIVQFNAIFSDRKRVQILKPPSTPIISRPNLVMENDTILKRFLYKVISCFY